MYITKPVWDVDFRCLAANCPDTCCAGWEIVVDDQSANRFRAMEDEMGARLRAALITVDGETQMARRNGRCVMLNDQNLCDLYAAYGQGALGRTCRLHPRFVVDYGARREVMPGLSCPAWVEAYLLRAEKVEFVTEETDDPITDYTDIDAALFFKLQKARKKAIDLLQDRTLPLPERMTRLLVLAEETDGVREGGCLQTDILAAYFAKLRSLEILTEEWRRLLQVPPRQGSLPPDEIVPLLEKVLVYDVFRFFLRGVYDGRVLPWAKLAIFHALVLRRIGNGCTTKEEFCEVIRLYSKEIEHSAENVESLHRAFSRRSGRYSAAGLEKGIKEG